MSKKEFLKLPIEERRKILAAQAENLVEHYEQMPDDMDLQAEMHLQRQTVERLTKDRDQLRRELDSELEASKSYKAQVDALHSRAAMLNRMRHFARHSKGCSVNRGGVDCDCGFYELIKEYNRL